MLNASALQPSAGAEQVLLHSADLELKEMTSVILDAYARLKPDRLVLDALSYMRLLAGSPLLYRHTMLAIQQCFAAGGSTVLLLDDVLIDVAHKGIYGLVDGVIQLDQQLTRHSTLRRHLQVIKLRAQPFIQGQHELQIQTGGLQVFPPLRITQNEVDDLPPQHRWPRLTSGVPALDDLLGGGLELGTGCLLIGAAGTGKTSLVTLYASAVAGQGKTAAVFLFDESIDTFLNRAAQLGMDLRPAVKAGIVLLHQINAGEVSPAQFTHLIRTTVENKGVDLVAIDSLTGYDNAVAQDRQVLVQMHELITYLNRLGVLSIVTIAQHGLLGRAVDSRLDISYLADTVIVLRHFEGIGHVRQSISVFKKRHSDHDKAIRELSISTDGIKVGETLERFRQILSGWPLTQNPWDSSELDPQVSSDSDTPGHSTPKSSDGSGESLS